MADLRPYLPIFYEQYCALNQKKASQYVQYKASGAESFALSFMAGRVQSIRQWSDLETSILLAQNKGNSWRTSRHTAHHFNDFSDWEKTLERMAKTMVPSGDPRPPFSDNPKIDIMPHNLLRYDPQVAQLESALIFHRAFQNFENLLTRGLVMDAECHWHHGARAWHNGPLNFAWCDVNGFCFLPQTRVDEYISIYHPQAPRRRRWLAFSSYKLAENIPLHLWTEHVEAAHKVPWVDWNTKQFDRIVLTPHVTAQIVKWMLEYLFSPNPQSNLCLQLNPSLELVDDPAERVFQMDGLIDDSGSIVRGRQLIADGQISPNISHAWRDAHCPVLRSPKQTENRQELAPQLDDNYPTLPPLPEPSINDDADLAPFVPETLSAHLPGRTLFIEKIQLWNAHTDEPQIRLPHASVLCKNGRCIGYVVPPPQPLDLLEILQNSMPITDVARVGGIACCGIGYEPT